MKNDIQNNQRKDVEFDQLLCRALECEVDEERLMRRVHSRLDDITDTSRFLQLLQALPMQWTVSTATACLLAAFSIGLLLPFNFVDRDDDGLIAFAFGDPIAIYTFGHIQQPSSGK